MRFSGMRNRRGTLGGQKKTSSRARPERGSIPQCTDFFET